MRRAIWDNADEYETLAQYFGVATRTVGSGTWPYNMDTQHYEELKKLYKEKKK